MGEDAWDVAVAAHDQVHVHPTGGTLRGAPDSVQHRRKGSREKQRARSLLAEVTGRKRFSGVAG